MSLSSLVQKRLFILGSFVVLLLAVLLYIRINALVKSHAQISRANNVELHLEYTLSYLADAETGHRGFLLTEDSTFLDPYLLAHRHIGGTLSKVEEKIKGHALQEQNLSWLRTLINQRFALFELSLSKRHTTKDTLRQYLFRGKSNMDRIRGQINRMILIEKTLLTQHEQEKDHYERLTPLSLLFLVFAMLSIIGLSYYGLTRQLKQTKKYATDLDHLNHELLLKNKQLENSVEELNAFNYIASHDLKEPLRKILFFTDILKSKASELQAGTTQYLDKIHTSGERMKGLLDDLLTYAKASTTERKTELIDLNQVVAAVLDNLSERLREKEAHVIYDDLPRLEAVPSQMQQLFENLISNSIKYSKENVPPVITIESQVIAKEEVPAAFEATHSWYHRIRFSDNGIGFPQENAEKIFELFQRLHQRHEFSGTGIGLTICKKVVQNHNGFIAAKSNVDQGTTFTIYLPASPFPGGGTQVQ